MAMGATYIRLRLVTENKIKNKLQTFGDSIYFVYYVLSYLLPKLRTARTCIKELWQTETDFILLQTFGSCRDFSI